MARVLKSETSLSTKHTGLVQEIRLLHSLRWVLLVAGIVLLALGVAVWLWKGNALLIMAGGALLFVWLGHFVKSREDQLEASQVGVGIQGEQGVTNRLAEELDDSYLILNDVSVRYERQKAQVDHLVIGPKGIFVLETKNWSGHIEGDERARQWLFYPTHAADRQPPKKFFNPVWQCRRQVKFVDRFLRSVGQDWPDIRPVVIMYSPHADWEIQNQTTEILYLSEVSEFILKSSARRGEYTAQEIETAAQLLLKGHA